MGQQERDAQVIAGLTSNSDIPIEFCFLLNCEICVWSPKLGLVLTRLVDDARTAQAYRRYLTTRGWAYYTMAEVGQHALRYGWPNWPLGVGEKPAEQNAAADGGS